MDQQETPLRQRILKTVRVATVFTTIAAAGSLPSGNSWTVARESDDRKEDLLKLVWIAQRVDFNASQRGLEKLQELGPEAKVVAPELIGLFVRYDAYATYVVETDSYHEFADPIGPEDVLGSIGPSALPLLIDCLHDDREEIRAGCALTLRKMGVAAKRAAPDLFERLSDSSYKVRCLALHALGHLNISQPAEVLEIASALSDPSVKVRLEAADTLGRIGVAANPAVPSLILALQPGPSPDNDDFSLCQHSAIALGEIGAAEAVQALIHIVELRSPTRKTSRARSAAIEALGNISRDAHAAVPTLLAMFERRDTDVEFWGVAAESIRQIDPDERRHFESLSGALKNDDNEAVRSWAARALCRIGVPAVPALIEALETDKHERVRNAAAQALLQIGPPARDALPALTSALKDDLNWGVRRKAAAALAEIAPTAEFSILPLTDALKDQDYRVRSAASKAIDRIKKSLEKATPNGTRDREQRRGEEESAGERSEQE